MGGKCVYCGEYVESGGYNFCFTKRYDKKTKEYIRDDWAHYTCYREVMDDAMYRMTNGLVGKPKDEPRQITLWDLEVKRGDD